MTNEEQLQQVRERIGKGIEWIGANDPDGAFHLWYISGILPHAPMPAQPSHVREQYQRYYAARKTFESLEKQEAALERKLASVVA